MQRGLRQSCRHGDGRDVAALQQRILRGDRPFETAVEVLGAVGAEGGGRVFENRAWVQQALVEPEAVDEGLERGAGRAFRGGRVDLPVDGVVEVVGRADPGLDLHCRGVDQQRRGVVHAHGLASLDVVADGTLQRRLRGPVQRQAGLRLRRELRQQGLHRMWRAEGQLLHRAQAQRQVHARLAPRLRMPRLPRLPEPLACSLQGHRPVGLARTATVRVLRDHRQRQRLGQRELRGPLAEVDEAGRAHAFDVAAIGREVEIGLEELALAVARLQPQRRADLPQLAEWRAAVDAVEAACELHRQRGRAAPCAPAVTRPGTAREAHRVHAGVPAVPAVFVEHHRLDQARVDLLERCPHAVLLVARERDAQQRAIARVEGA